MFFTASFSIPGFFLVLNPSVLHSLKKKKNIHFSSLLSKYPFVTSHFAYPTLQCVSSWEFFNRFDNSLLHLSISFQQWQQSLASKKKGGVQLRNLCWYLWHLLWKAVLIPCTLEDLPSFLSVFMLLPGHLPSSLESGFFVGLGFFSNHRVSGFFLQVFYFASS